MVRYKFKSVVMATKKLQTMVEIASSDGDGFHLGFVRERTNQ